MSTDDVAEAAADSPVATPMSAGEAGAAAGEPEAIETHELTQLVATADLSNVRFPVDLPAFRGSLEQLVIRAQRGEIDLATIPVAEITSTYRRQMPSDGTPEQLRDLADFMALAGRLVNLKAQSLMPTEGAEANLEAEEGDPASDAGRRLAEYRLYRAAAEALLAEPAEEGARSFLALVTPEVVAVERLRIPPERLAAAFRAVLERLQEVEASTITTVTYSVEEMASTLRTRLQREGSLLFEDVFNDVVSRLQAVALFLGLLELLRNGEASVTQDGPLASIRVRNNG